MVYGSLHERERFVLPEPGSADFRMAVHAVSDALVEWVSGERGMAATRVVLAMRAFGEERGKELYVVDADGENLQRLTWDQSIVASPAWSPDGTRIAYTSWKSGVPRLYERDLETGRDRELVPGGHGHQLTPSYHPAGHTVAFSVIGAEPNGLHTYNIRDRCCMTRLGGGAYHDISPGYSPDGTRLVFNSNRLGVATPQVYVRPAGRGSAELLSPYRFGEGGYFADPDWSPGSSKVAFAGGIRGRRQANRYNILVADFEKGGQPAGPAYAGRQQRGSQLGAGRQAHRLQGHAQLRNRGLHRRRPPRGAPAFWWRTCSPKTPTGLRRSPETAGTGEPGARSGASRRGLADPFTGLFDFAYI